MPIYEYKCPTCERKFDGWSLMSERHEPQECPRCATVSPFIISAPRVFADFPAYVSPSTGNVVEGRRARINDLARSGCRPYEAGEIADVQRRQKEVEKDQDATIDAAVERTLVEIKNG